MWRFLIRIWRLLRAEIVFGFLIGCVFWIGILGWQAAYVPTNAEKQKCHDAAERSGAKAEECKSLWERTTSDPVAFFTFWLVIFTGGLTVSTILLWRAGERQRELSEDTAERQLRAYVHVEGARILNFGTGENRVQIVCKNSGQTPAYQFSSWAGVGGGDLRGGPDFDGACFNKKAVQTVLPAQGTNTILLDYGPLMQSHIDKIIAGQAAIWAWGILNYRDAFGKNRSTRFRMVFAGMQTNPSGGMAFADEGNESD